MSLDIIKIILYYRYIVSNDQFVTLSYITAHSLKHPFHCPKYGYVSGWHTVGQKVKVKCCTEPGN